MTETLTESFCERCGTRYTFESAAPRAARLKGVKVLSRGFKNFVMSDDTSLDEAMAAARSETDREVTTQQLDAFHKTFNFCMQCRQYTCGNCWNEADGRCLTCAPNLGHEIMPSPFPDLDAHADIHLGGGSSTGGANGSGALAGTPGPAEAESAAMAWPSSDFLADAEAEPDLASSDTPEPDMAAGHSANGVDPGDLEPIDLEARFALLDQISPTNAAADGTIATPEPTETPVPPPIEVRPVPDQVDIDPMVAERSAAAAGQTSELLRRFRPGQSLDDEIEAYEREQAALAASAAALVAAAGTSEEPEAAAAAGSVGSDAVAAAVSPAPLDAPVTPPEPAIDLAPAAAATASPAEIPADIPPGIPPAPRDDIIPQPTWQMVAPDVADTPAAPPAAPAAPPAEPQWPAQPEWPSKPEWPSQRPASNVPFLGRPTGSGGTLDLLWAESAREVVSPTAAQASPGDRPVGGVAPCVSCGLSLSANARFCRRCGTRQA